MTKKNHNKTLQEAASHLFKNKDHAALYNEVLLETGTYITAQRSFDSKTSIDTENGKRKVMGADLSGSVALSQTGKGMKILIEKAEEPLKSLLKEALPSSAVISGKSCTEAHTTEKMAAWAKLNSLCPIRDVIVASCEGLEASSQGSEKKQGTRKSIEEKTGLIAAHLRKYPNATSSQIGAAIGVDQSDVRRLWGPIKEAMKNGSSRRKGWKNKGVSDCVDESSYCHICKAPLSESMECEICATNIEGECKTCHFTNTHPDQATP